MAGGEKKLPVREEESTYETQFCISSQALGSLHLISPRGERRAMISSAAKAGSARRTLHILRSTSNHQPVRSPYA